MLRCAYCHGAAEGATTCVSCGTLMHADCRAQAGACPTLGCGDRPGVPLDLKARPARGSWWSWLPFLAPLLWIGACQALDWINAPVIEVRNDSGRTLTAVRLSAVQPDAGPRVAGPRTLAPGETLSVSGAHDEYELNLQEVAFDDQRWTAREAYERQRDPFSFYRYTARAGRVSTFAIGPDGRLRTIVRASGPESGRCACPDGNAALVGSAACPISIHRFDHERGTRAVEERGQ